MYVLILPLIKGKNMAIHNASSASGFKNNGGTALKAGVPYSGNASTVKTFSNDRRADNYPFGSTLVNYAHLTSIDSNPLIPSPWSSARSLVKRSTRVLKGQPNNNLLTSGTYAPELRSSIHPINSYRTSLQSTAYRDNQFNIYLGKFTAGYPDNQIDDFGFDMASMPTRDNPGNLVFKNYRNISIVPYQSKTG